MPRTLEQNQKIKDERRHEIMVKSTILFAYKDYENVTIDDLTKTVGCSHGLFYHYYKNKTDLHNHIMREAALYFIQLVHDNKHGDTIYKSCENVIDAFLKLLRTNEIFRITQLYLILNVRLKYSNIPGNEEHMKMLNDVFMSVYYEFKKGQKLGQFGKENAMDYLISLIALLKGLVYNRLYIPLERFKCPPINVVMGILNS